MDEHVNLFLIIRVRPDFQLLAPCSATLGSGECVGHKWLLKLAPFNLSLTIAIKTCICYCLGRKTHSHKALGIDEPLAMKFLRILRARMLHCCMTGSTNQFEVSWGK
eukprot:scaffold833_cov352-Pavlova_lutheri.AAC.12